MRLLCFAPSRVAESLQSADSSLMRISQHLLKLNFLNCLFSLEIASVGRRRGFPPASYPAVG